MIKPFVNLSGIALFFLFLFCHVFHWRFKRPKNEILTLFVQFVILPGVFIVIFVIAGLHGKCLLSRLDMVAVYFLHLSLSGVYIASYPAAQADSPSLKILRLYSESNATELTIAEISRTFNKEKILSDRLNELKHYRWLHYDGVHFTSTWLSTLIAYIYQVYRSLLGLPKKGI